MASDLACACKVSYGFTGAVGFGAITGAKGLIGCGGRAAIAATRTAVAAATACTRALKAACFAVSVVGVLSVAVL